MQAASAYLRDAREREDKDDEREGSFRIIDTFLYFTPIAFKCYLAGSHVTYVA